MPTNGMKPPRGTSAHAGSTAATAHESNRIPTPTKRRCFINGLFLKLKPRRPKESRQQIWGLPHGWAADAVVIEAEPFHCPRLIEIAAIEDHGRAHALEQLLKLRPLVVTPFGHD